MEQNSNNSAVPYKKLMLLQIKGILPSGLKERWQPVASDFWLHPCQVLCRLPHYGITDCTQPAGALELVNVDTGAAGVGETQDGLSSLPFQSLSFGFCFRPGSPYSSTAMHWARCV